MSSNPPPKSLMSQPRAFTDPEAAVDHLIEIYAQGRALLERHFEKYANRVPDLKRPMPDIPIYGLMSSRWNLATVFVAVLAAAPCPTGPCGSPDPLARRSPILNCSAAIIWNRSAC